MTAGFSRSSSSTNAAGAMAVINGVDSDHRRRWKWRRLDFVEWEDFKLHDGENEMRGEGGG